MSNRLLIKSTICANDKLPSAVKVSKEDTVEYNVDKEKKKLTVTVNGISTDLPIDDYSLSLD